MSLKLDSVRKADGRLNCFLKAEKVNPLAKFPKPRMIFPRSPRYNLEVASRLKPFEHWLWGRLTGNALGVSIGDNKTRLCGKGLGPKQRASLIIRKWNKFKECVCFEVDGKAFEAHVGPYHLEKEHSVYKAAYPGDTGLANLLDVQKTLTGRLPCGAKFSRDGGRASGDFNTGMGNTILMLAVVVACLKQYNVAYDVLADGDNCLIFLEASSLSGVLDTFCQNVLDLSGFEMTLERPVRILEEIRFGQCAPVNLGGNLGWTMVRDYKKVISGATSSHQHLYHSRFAREWLTGVGLCELSLSRGVPVLQAWASSILNGTNYSGRVRLEPFRDYFIQGAKLDRTTEMVGVSGVARASFERAFGLTSQEQIMMEHSFQFAFEKSLDFERVEWHDLAAVSPRISNTFLSDVAC